LIHIGAKKFLIQVVALYLDQINGQLYQKVIDEKFYKIHL